MYSSQNLSKIISTLSNFSREQLFFLRDAINRILADKKAEQWTNLDLVELLDGTSIVKKMLEEQEKFIYRCFVVKTKAKVDPCSTLETCFDDNESSLFFGREKIVKELKEAATIKKEIQVQNVPQKSRRPSGIWKGKVNIPDNFDDLSSDIISDFGMDK
jgi:hypothetical protein